MFLKLQKYRSQIFTGILFGFIFIRALIRDINRGEIIFILIEIFAMSLLTYALIKRARELDNV